MRQFNDWRRYDEIDPIGGGRSDWQAASVCATVMNAAAVMIGSKQRVKISDFLLDFSGERASERAKDKPQQPHWKSMKFIAQMMVAASQADVSREAALEEKRKRRGRQRS